VHDVLIVPDVVVQLCAQVGNATVPNARPNAATSMRTRRFAAGDAATPPTTTPPGALASSETT